MQQVEISKKEAQWSDLPPELLHLISQKLPDISDYVRFRCLSRSCRSSAPADMSPKLPWLMLPNDPDSHTRSFYSLSFNKVYTLPLSELSGKHVCGSSHGWLIVLDVRNPGSPTAFLLNPLTRAKIQLPPPTDIPRQLGFRVEQVIFDGAQHYRVHREQAEQSELVVPHSSLATKAYISFAYLSSSPNFSRDWMVLAILPDSRKFAFCRPGDNAWTVLDSNLQHPVEAIAYHKMRLYIIDLQGNTSVLHASSNPGSATLIPSMKVPAANGFVVIPHILESPNGELILVTCLTSQPNGATVQLGIRIYKVDVEQLKLSETMDVDNHHALFLNYPLCIPTSNIHPGFTANCIYFTCSHEVRPSQKGRFLDIGTVSTRNIAIYQYSVHNNQVVQHLLSNWKQMRPYSGQRCCWIMPTI